LTSTQHSEIVPCVSTDGSQCVSKTAGGVFAFSGRQARGRSADTHDYLEKIRGTNRARLSADFTPEWMLIPMAPGIHSKMLQIDTLGEPGSGIVHYSPLVAHYFAHIPLCSARPGWAVFVASRSLVRLRGLALCKTRQAGRHNFVNLHSAELGIDFLEVTVLVFFKTPNSQNRVADM